MTHFVFDCDDVLLNWQAGFQTYLNERGIRIDAAGPHSWDLSKWIGCSPESARSWVHRFNHSPAFSRLQPMEGADDAIWALRKAGHSTSVLTACGSSPSLRQARLRNMDDVFMRCGNLPYEDVRMLKLGESKFPALYEIYDQIRGRTDIVLIEDNFDHARAGLANAMTAYCMRRSHNRDHERLNPDTSVLWADSLNEIVRQYVQQKVEK